MGIRVTDSWQRFVHLPVFIMGGCLGPRLEQMPGMVEAPRVPLFTPPGKSQGTHFGTRWAHRDQLRLTVLKYGLPLHSVPWSVPF